ncbi:MAG: hypothetical protein ACLGIK_01630 [Gemmatimonadota bacterium]
MTARSLITRLAVVVAIAAVVTPSVAAAQSAVRSESSPTARVGAPRRDASVAGIRLQVAADAPRPAALAASRSGRGQALAIVGGAAFLGGLLIGDDAGTAIAIGGLAMGIYGLWLWLN